MAAGRRASALGSTRSATLAGGPADGPRASVLDDVSGAITG